MACDNGQFILRGTFPLNIFIIHILADPWHCRRAQANDPMENVKRGDK